MEVDEYIDGATFISEEKEEIVLALAVTVQIDESVLKLMKIDGSG